MKIIPRTDWGARYGAGAPVPRRPVRRVVVHHSAVPDVPEGASLTQVQHAIQGIERHHVETNKWSAIGYTFLIDQEGRVWEGRGYGQQGAHAGDAQVNQDSIGVCFLINGAVRPPTEHAWDAARDLIRDAIRRGQLAADYTLIGHRDVPRATTCPGPLVYAGLDRLRGLTLESDHLGRRVWSPSLRDYLIVSRYASDVDWSYVRLSEIARMPGYRAGSPLSRMPERP
jgi:hypothetical protein